MKKIKEYFGIFSIILFGTSFIVYDYHDYKKETSTFYGENISATALNQLSSSDSSFSSSSPVFINPKDGDSLTLGDVYKFSVAPMKGAAAFRFSIYQNNKLIYNSEQDPTATANSKKFKFKTYYDIVPGILEIRASAKINEIWTPETKIKVNLIEEKKSESLKQSSSTPAKKSSLMSLVFDDAVSTTTSSTDNCLPSFAIMCSANFLAESSNAILNLEKSKILEEEIITYIPATDDDWKSVIYGSVYFPLKDIAREIPSMLKKTSIFLPKTINVKKEDKEKICRLGLTEINGENILEKLSNLIKEKAILEKALQKGYNYYALSGLPIPPSSGKCVYAPSYEDGTFQDVYYYLPKGACKTFISNSLKTEIANIKNQIAAIKINLFNEGYADDGILLNAMGKKERNEITAAEKLRDKVKWLKRCRDLAEEDNNLSDEELALLKDIYGKACEESKKVFKQFNHSKDAPLIPNIPFFAPVFSTEWVYPNFKNKLGETQNSNSSIDFSARTLTKSKYNFYSPNDSYELLPIPIISGPIPLSLGYIKLNLHWKQIEGACTGISNMVDYFFSNAKYKERNSPSFNFGIPSFSEKNKCFNVPQSSFQEWFNSKTKKLPLDATNEEKWDATNMGWACEVKNVGHSENNIFTLLGIEVVDYILSEKEDFNKLLENNNGLWSNFFHLFILDELISGYTPSISVSMKNFGGHAMFAYSCNEDTSLNTFDPNIPWEKVVIQKEDKGFWNVPTWKNIKKDKNTYEKILSNSDELKNEMKTVRIYIKKTLNEILETINTKDDLEILANRLEINIKESEKNIFLTLIKNIKNNKENAMEKLVEKIEDSFMNKIEDTLFNNYEQISEDLILTDCSNDFLPLDSCQK